MQCWYRIVLTSVVLVGAVICEETRDGAGWRSQVVCYFIALLGLGRALRLVSCGEIPVSSVFACGYCFLGLRQYLLDRSLPSARVDSKHQSTHRTT